MRSLWYTKMDTFALFLTFLLKVLLFLLGSKITFSTVVIPLQIIYLVYPRTLSLPFFSIILELLSDVYLESSVLYVYFLHWISPLWYSLEVDRLKYWDKTNTLKLFKKVECIPHSFVNPWRTLGPQTDYIHLEPDHFLLEMLTSVSS